MRPAFERPFSKSFIGIREENMNGETESLLDLYRDEIKRLSGEYHTAGGVLYSAVLAVVNFNTQDAPDQTVKNHGMAPINDVYASSGDFIQIQSAGKNGLFQGLVHSVHGPVNNEVDIITSDLDDSMSGRLSKAPHSLQASNSQGLKVEYTRASVPGLILFERHAIIRAQISNLLAEKVLPMKPEMTSTERGIKESELLSFSSLSTSDLYRNDQMQTIAKMLEAHVRALPNFTGTLCAGSEDGSILRRRYFRQLSALTFAQILSAERVREPVVVKQYYPLTDDLLLALHWPPPERRIRKETWTWTGPIPVINDPASIAAARAREEALNKGKKKPVKKVTKKGSQKMVEVPTTMSCTISTTTLTPAAHSIALVKRSAEANANSWLSVHVNGSVLGLRMETSTILVSDLLAEQDHDDQHHDARSIKSTHSHDSAQGPPEEMPGSPEGSELSPMRADGSATKLSKNASAVSLGTASVQEPPRGVFFCHTEDDIRFSACAGPCPQPIRKPDGFGTICLIATYPDAMTITVCSNGTTKITLPVANTSLANAGNKNKPIVNVFDAVVGVETDRFIGAGGAVLSNYSKVSTTFTNSDGSPVQFSKEIRQADGSRVLIVRPTGGSYPIASLAASFGAAVAVDTEAGAAGGGTGEMTSRSALTVSRQDTFNSAVSASSAVAGMGRQQSTLTTTQAGGFKKNSIGAFYQSVCQGAPQGWTCVKLGADGSAVFFTCPPDSAMMESDQGILHPTLLNIRTTLVDAETKAKVSTFTDGRILTQYADGRVECKFGDGTVITSHAAGAMVAVTKPNLPAIEVDTEIDDVSRQHARGIEVPINKGGERVRSRIALPDGTAVLVKYDTRLTTKTNGSIKVVRRDKTVLLLQDSGAVTYTPRAAWSAKAAAVFAAECADLPPLAVNSPARNVTIANGAEGNATANANTRSNATSRAHSPTSRGAATTAGATGGPSSPSSQSRNTLSNSVVSKRSSATLNNIKPRRKTSPLRNRTGNNQSNRSGNDPDSLSGTEESEVQDAVFTFDIVTFKCHIQDYEFNAFSIDLSSPDSLNPSVTLSGEVEGLKPPAVADKPMEPRVFVVNRSAEATELMSGTAIDTMETLARTCPDVNKITSSVHLQPSDLGPATLNKFFIRRRLLGARGDGFTFQEVFGSRYWYPQTPPAAGLNAERNNQLAINKANKRRSTNQNGDITSTTATSSAFPARYYDMYSVVEQSPLSAEGHVKLQLAIKKCEEFRANRLTSLDRFKVEEDRSPEELQEEEALAKRLKLAFKAAKVNAAKKKEAKAKLLAAATPSIPEEPSQLSAPGAPLKRQTSAIPEGDNEDGDEEDLDGFPEDEEPAELEPEEVEIRDTFDDFCVQAQNEGFTIDDSFTIAKSSLQDAFIRLFNRYIPYDEILHVMRNCEECDASFEELTLGEFRSLYFSMKESLANEDNKPTAFPRLKRIDTSMSQDSADDGSIGDHTANTNHTHMSSPTYWQSPLGQKVIRSLPPAAPPLDLRRLEWDNEGAVIRPPQDSHDPDKYSQDLYGDEVYPEEEFPESAARMVSTAHPAVGSALQAARRSNSNRAATAPE